MTSAEFEKSTLALRTLEALGFDVKEQWRELTLRQEAQERGVPTEDDRRYELPLVAPSTESHLKGGNEVLDPSRLWNGMSYKTTPGQRGILRDLYELPPSQTVTVKWVEPWPGTRHPYRMTIVVDIHVPFGKRAQCSITEVGKFFRMAAERDEELRGDGALEIAHALTLGEIAKLESEERWAIADLSGVKVEKKVEVIRSSDESFTVVCMFTGNKATVNRKEFFTTVNEYIKLHRPKKKREAKFDATPALDELIANL
jgi:hypothetical protein